MDALVSIIIPTYNTKLYIDRCLQSVINQTYKNLEVIVIDDGSQDQTAEYIRLHYPTVLIYNQVNKGVSSARNHGIDVAKGDYIFFVDSDDWIDKDVVSELLKAIEKDNYDIAILSHIRELMHSQTQVVKSAKTYKTQNIQFDLSSIMRNRKEFMFASPCGRLYRNSILQFYNIRFNTKVHFGEDRIFNMDYFSHAPRYITVNSYYHYTAQERQSSVSILSNKRLDDECYVLAKEQQWLRSYQIVDNQKIMSRFIISVIRSLFEALFMSSEILYFRKGLHILRTIQNSVDMPSETFEYKHSFLFVCYRYNLLLIVYLYYRCKIYYEIHK